LNDQFSIKIITLARVFCDVRSPGFIKGIGQPKIKMYVIVRPILSLLE